MPHRRRSTLPLVLVALALLVTACGSQPAVHLEVSPAAIPDGPAPDAEEVGSSPPVEEVEEVEEVEQVERPRPAEVDEVDPGTAPQRPAAPAAPTSTPTPADPELVIDEDGCATDVATGLVVACYDPASGPDDEL